MKPRTLKVEFYDNEGTKHSITIDGPVTREKVGKILDIVELMAGSPRATTKALAYSPHKLDRLSSAIMSQLNAKEFTSTEAKTVFEKSFGEKIPLSTVSTYLSRLVERGVLERGSEKPSLHYRVTQEQPPRAFPSSPSPLSS